MTTTRTLITASMLDELGWAEAIRQLADAIDENAEEDGYPVPMISADLRKLIGE